MNKILEVGTRVRYKHVDGAYYPNGLVGKVGTVCYSNGSLIAVEFDEEVDDIERRISLHDCNGHTKEFYGWWCNEHILEVVS